MDIPLAVAGPAALLAGGAWLRAQARLDYDWRMLSGLVRAEITLRRLEKRDRISLFYLLEDQALNRRVADRTLLVYEGKSWTFKETYDIIVKYGTWLKTKHAVNSGDVVAMEMMNSAQFIFLWFGLWSIGARPAFINYNLAAESLSHSIKSSGANVVFSEEQFRPKFTPAVMNALASAGTGGRPVKTVFIDSGIEEEVMNTQGVREPDSCRGEIKRADMGILISTSGTTGLPKSAIVSWHKLWASARFVSTFLGLKETDRYYTCMPLYHSSASLLAVCPNLVTGSALIIGRRFSTKTFWPEVRQYGATVIQHIGETCRYLLAAPPQFDPLTGANLDRAHKIRLAFGNGLRPDVWEPFKERFGIESIAEFWSATESPLGLWNYSSNKLSSGAIGDSGAITSALTRQVLVLAVIDWDTESPKRDPNNNNFCIRVQTNEPGELLIKLDPANINARFQGYYGNQAATESKIMRDVFVKGDAYFRSGDVMRRDNEGLWWFCDRIGDTFRWKSENVSTTEVSEALGTHPHIHEANVYGVDVPHHDGRIGCAAVLFDSAHSDRILRGDASSAAAIQGLMNDVALHARSKLPRYAVPGFLRVVREVVATGNNKQQKTELKREGVDPGKMGEDRIFWLRDGKYVPFGDKDWRELNGGAVKL